jgi:hypothetical protein
MSVLWVHSFSMVFVMSFVIYIYKNVTVRLYTNGTQKHVNLRKLFTDGVAIWTQCCRQIRACVGITFIYIYIYFIYLDVKTCFYALTAGRWRWLSTESM